MPLAGIPWCRCLPQQTGRKRAQLRGLGDRGPLPVAKVLTQGPQPAARQNEHPHACRRPRPAYLAEEGSVPLHTVAHMSGLDFRVKSADHIVQHLYANVIPPHAGACAPCVLVCGLKNLKGPEPGGGPSF